MVDLYVIFYIKEHAKFLCVWKYCQFVSLHCILNKLFFLFIQYTPAIYNNFLSVERYEIRFIDQAISAIYCRHQKKYCHLYAVCSCMHMLVMKYDFAILCLRILSLDSLEISENGFSSCLIPCSSMICPATIQQ